MPKVSIIMPVYRVEKYVARAIESILNQTMGDFEFLIVDDGTPDKSGEICDAYAQKDTRIKVFHKENSGAPSARNHAIRLATGNYFYFLDSDDWAEPTMLEDLVSLAEKTKAQLVVTGFYIDTYYGDSDDEKYTQLQSVEGITYKTQEHFRRDAHRLFDKNLLYTPWNKLYDAKYIKDNNLYFPETFWDDFPFNLSVVRDVERVSVSPNAYYHFIRQRAESETARYRSDMYQKREEEREWLEELYRYWHQGSPDIEEFLSRRYIERLIGCIENITNKQCTLSAREKKAEIKEMIRTDYAIMAAQKAKPRSFYMKILLWSLKTKWTWLIYAESKFISRTKRKNIKRFAALKANR